jgi:hypothetical protein
VTPLLTAAATLAAVLVGYWLGRLRPWRMLGDWAASQLRFVGGWATGSTARQLLLAVAVAVTEPRGALRSWRRSKEPEAPVNAVAMKPKGRP